MTMLEPLVRRFLEHPKRRFLVTIVTCAIALLFIWPSVDKYGGLCQDERDSHTELAAAQELIAHVEHQKLVLADRAKLLTEMEERGIADEQAYELRGKVVDMVRAAGCQLKRIDLAQPMRRKWKSKDDPLEPKTGLPAGEDTPYLIRTQQLSLAIAGESKSIKKLLGQLHSANKLIHTQRFSMKPFRSNHPGHGPKVELVLELELTLFGLELEKKEPEKKPA